MDGRVKPVKPKPKKRPRPVNPRYQASAPVSMPAPGVPSPSVVKPQNPFLMAQQPQQPTATEAALGMMPVNVFNAARPTSGEQYGQPTITANGGLPPKQLVIPPPKNPNATRQTIGKIAGVASEILGQMFAPTEQAQPAPQFNFTPVGGTVPRTYKEYGEDILFKKQAQRPIFRKKGGRVKPGQRYIVGEEGPEELILDTPGRVIANKDIDDPAVKAQIKTLGGTEQVPVAELPIDDLTTDARPLPMPVNPTEQQTLRPAPVMPEGQQPSTVQLQNKGQGWDERLPDGRSQVDIAMQGTPMGALLRPRNPALQPQPTETEAALGMTPQNPFNAVRPTSQQQYGQPTISADGGVPARVMPINPTSVQRPQIPSITNGAGAEGPTGTAAVRPVNPALGNIRPIDAVLEKIRDRSTRDYKGKPDAEHPYRKGRGIKSTLKAAGLAFLQAFSQNAGLPLNQRIMASLGGAAAGGVAGTVNPNLAGQMMNQSKLQQLYSQYKQLSGVEDAELNRSYKQEQIEGMGARARQADARLDQSERRLKGAEKKAAESEYDRGFRRAMAKLRLGYKRGVKPDLDAELARFGIDVEQWDDNKRTFWQGQNLMTFDENGEAVPVTNEKGESVTDITREPVTVDYEGQKFTVSQTEAFRGLTAAGGRNTNIQNQDIKDENDRIEQLGIAKAELSGIDTQIGGLDNDIKDLQAQLDKLDPANVYGDAQKATSIQSQIQQHKSRRITLAGERTKLAGKVKTLSEKPKPRNTGSVPKVSVAVSEDEFKKALQGKNIPQTEWAWRIADAKRNGVIR